MLFLSQMCQKPVFCGQNYYKKFMANIRMRSVSVFFPVYIYPHWIIKSLLCAVCPYIFLIKCMVLNALSLTALFANITSRIYASFITSVCSLSRSTKILFLNNLPLSFFTLIFEHFPMGHFTVLILVCVVKMN